MATPSMNGGRYVGMAPLEREGALYVVGHDVFSAT